MIKLIERLDNDKELVEQPGTIRKAYDYQLSLTNPNDEIQKLNLFDLNFIQHNLGKLINRRIHIHESLFPDIQGAKCNWDNNLTEHTLHILRMGHKFHLIYVHSLTDCKLRALYDEKNLKDFNLIITNYTDYYHHLCMQDSFLKPVNKLQLAPSVKIEPPSDLLDQLEDLVQVQPTNIITQTQESKLFKVKQVQSSSAGSRNSRVSDISSISSVSKQLQYDNGQRKKLSSLIKNIPQSITFKRGSLIFQYEQYEQVVNLEYINSGSFQNMSFDNQVVVCQMILDTIQAENGVSALQSELNYLIQSGFQ